MSTKEETERRYGTKPPQNYLRPADPGMTLAEVIELFDEDEICGQIARELATAKARIAELENLLSAERMAHAATRGIADAAVRGQMRAEERLAKLEAALEWATEHWPFVELCPLAVCFRPGQHGAIYEPFGDGGKTRVDALIALHERAGK